MRSRERIDLLPYVQALPLLVLNPVIFLGPLLAAVLDAVIGLASPNAGGIVTLITFLLDSFGLAVAIIVADGIWRRGKSSFDEAWDDARRRAGDILLAAIGINFITYVASLLGETIGGVYLGIALSVAAVVFLIFTIPAAAIGGTPGGAAIQASIDIVRGQP